MNAANQPICGRRNVRPRATVPSALSLTGKRAAYSDACVEPAGHTGLHCSEDGTEWEATR